MIAGIQKQMRLQEGITMEMIKEIYSIDDFLILIDFFWLYL